MILDGDTEHRLAHVVAANVQVAEAKRMTRPEGAIRLSQLKAGEVAEVIELDPECRGFSRRRLLDLGLTPETRVEVTLDNPFGDPRGFRVRGTTIALRNQQADQIWIQRRAAASQDQPVAEEQHA